MKPLRILISGAGIAGFTLAYWLKHHGFTPTIIEKHPRARGGGYKVDMRGTALDVAKKMGIYQDLLDANVNLLRSKFVFSNSQTFEFEGDILGNASEGDIEVNRWDLAEILSKKVDDIEILYNDSITKIDEKLVYFEKMSPREFDLVIGADGQYSTVRRLVFGEDAKFLQTFGIQFCVFPIPNIFNEERCDIVFLDKGKLATAYAVGKHSYAALAFHSDTTTSTNCEAFTTQFQNLGWHIPELIGFMKESTECYFNTIAQVRMSNWSKGRVALIGDAAHSVQSMGTSLAIVGAYIIAEELAKSPDDHTLAYANYQKRMQNTVRAAQDFAQANQEAFTTPALVMKLQLYLLKILPKSWIQHFLQKGKTKLKEIANMITIS